MLRGFYTASYGMLSQQRKTEMLANNMANSNTPGFKTDQAAIRAFPEMLLQRIEMLNGGTSPLPKKVGSLNTGVYLQETMPKYSQGTLNQTELTTDLALLDVNLPVNPDTGLPGTVFFTIENPTGETRYTRNGSFTLDGDGFLTTASGLYVLDQQSNRIQLQSDQFTVNEEGFVTGSNGETARIGVGFTNDPMTMLKEGDGLFRSENGALANAYNVEGAAFRIQQGYIEQSNVDVSQTMTSMMMAYRTFEANQKVLQAYDNTLQKTVNEVGRLG